VQLPLAGQSAPVRQLWLGSLSQVLPFMAASMVWMLARSKLSLLEEPGRGRRML
jgi:hypothetical protein